MEEEKPIARIQLFAKATNLSIKKFEKACGLTPHIIQNAINRKSNLSDDTLGKIMLAFPNLNFTWVLLGRGQMLLNESVSSDLQQEPDYKEFLKMLQQIGNDSLAISMRDKLFELYQNNSHLKTELLNAYRLIGNLKSSLAATFVF